MTTHEVSCDVAQASCGSPNVWYAPGFVSSSSGCCHCQQSCENVSDSCNYHDVPDAPVSSTTSTPQPAWGCYDVPTHSCNCDQSLHGLFAGGHPDISRQIQQLAASLDGFVGLDVLPGGSRHGLLQCGDPHLRLQGR